MSAIEDADVILMVGTFPRKECPLIEARIRKRFLEGNVRIATVYHNDSDYQQKHTYDVEHLGSDLSVVQSIAEGTPFLSSIGPVEEPIDPLRGKDPSRRGFDRYRGHAS